MVESFKSIKSNVNAEFKEKGSKFIAFLYPFFEENQLKDIVAELKLNHANAVHFCFAYRLKPSGIIYRVSDDGEPNGTAGKPILNQLLAAELTNVLCVVVRYFGGTKLGVSGLINAYKEAAKLAITDAEIIEEKITFTCSINFPYNVTTEISKLISQFEGTVTIQKFEADCLQLINFPVKYKEMVISVLESITYLGVNFKVSEN